MPISLPTFERYSWISNRWVAAQIPLQKNEDRLEMTSGSDWSGKNWNHMCIYIYIYVCVCVCFDKFYIFFNDYIPWNTWQPLSFGDPNELNIRINQQFEAIVNRKPAKKVHFKGWNSLRYLDVGLDLGPHHLEEPIVETCGKIWNDLVTLIVKPPTPEVHSGSSFCSWFGMENRHPPCSFAYHLVPPSDNKGSQINPGEMIAEQIFLFGLQVRMLASIRWATLLTTFNNSAVILLKLANKLENGPSSKSKWYGHLSN